MKIAVVGGTGKLGRGLAMRLAKTHSVLIGSRDESKGRETAKQLKATAGGDITGGTNESVAKECDVAIMAIPDLDLALLQPLQGPLEGKIVISPMVPMQMEDGIMKLSMKEGSAAQELASILRGSRVVAALHTVPAPTIADPNHKLDFDVLVACDVKEDYEEASRLIGSIEGLRPLYVGPLSTSREIEALTPLILNVAKMNGLKRLSLKLVG